MVELFKFFVSSLTEGLENENTTIAALYSEYFSEGSALWNAILIDGVIALIVAGIFYFVFCNKTIMTRISWVITLLIVGIVAYVATDKVVIGSLSDSGENTGFYASIEETRSNLLDENVDAPTEVCEAINADVDEHINELHDGTSKLSFEFGLTNAVMTVIVYFLLSLGFKRLTKHGKSIPF